ncbi:MAG: arylsulfatase A-like enzyme [Myxococcota bacterium]|jgi:arylsulfatase A-like enzyme
MLVFAWTIRERYSGKTLRHKTGERIVVSGRTPTPLHARCPMVEPHFRLRSGAAVVGIALTLLSWVACTERDSRPNVLLITIDTLRADHLSLYGYSRETMPNLATWADEGVVFEHCYSPLPLTDPSMSSIMTGLHPTRHGVRQSGRTLSTTHPTLAEVLQANGYATGAFVSRVGLVGRGGLDRGFDTHDFAGGEALEHVRGKGRIEAEKWQRRADSVTEAALTWLGVERQEPFFAWLHYFDPHAYYDPPAPFRGAFRTGLESNPVGNLSAWWGKPRDQAEMVAAYDAEILTVDHHLDRVVTALKQHGVWDSTLVVVTSDHGESLGEHGHLDHGEWLYDEQLHVPLIMRLPGVVPSDTRVPGLVRLHDIASTILELVGLTGNQVEEIVESMDGISARPMLTGSATASRRIFVESENCPAPDRGPHLAPGMVCYPEGSEGKLRAVFDGRFKLIITPRVGRRTYELYDLENDPEEHLDLSGQQPNRVRELEAAIDEFWQGATSKSIVNDEIVEQLRALGYAD